jgi:hypothetical protein
MLAPKNLRSGPYRRPKRPRWRVFVGQSLPKALPKLRFFMRKDCCSPDRGFFAPEPAQRLAQASSRVFVGQSLPKALPKLRFLMRKDCCRMRARKNPRSGPYRRPKRPRSRVFRARACPKACPSFVEGFCPPKSA